MLSDEPMQAQEELPEGSAGQAQQQRASSVQLPRPNREHLDPDTILIRIMILKLKYFCSYLSCDVHIDCIFQTINCCRV